MNKKVKKHLVTLAIIAISMLFIIQACSSNGLLVEQKPGALLWGENCVRCHNAPTPKAFSDKEWETIGMHMSVRANLTDEEVKRIVGFLKMAN